MEICYFSFFQIVIIFCIFLLRHLSYRKTKAFPLVNWREKPGIHQKHPIACSNPFSCNILFSIMEGKLFLNNFEYFCVVEEIVLLLYHENKFATSLKTKTRCKSCHVRETTYWRFVFAEVIFMRRFPEFTFEFTFRIHYRTLIDRQKIIKCYCILWKEEMP